MRCNGTDLLDSNIGSSPGNSCGNVYLYVPVIYGKPRPLFLHK